MKNKKLLDLIFSHRAKRVLSFLFVFFAVVFLFLLTSPVLAQDMTQGLGQFANETGLPATPLPVLIGRIVRIFISFLGLIAVVIILYGGFLWMTSGGDQDKIDKAKKLMRAGLIGLLIIVLAYALATFVIYLIGRIVGPGGPGGGCTINEQRGLCELCVGPEPGHWAWQYQWPGCSFNPEDFVVNKILTTHGGDYYNNDVYLCSAVQPIFNHWVDGKVIQELAQANRLKIVDAHNNIFSGTWESRSNISIFKHPDLLFSSNTTYTAILPKDIADTNGKLLQSCLADRPHCTYDNQTQSYMWAFTTGTNTDTTKPYITSTYPIFDKTNPTYPDRNVSRKPILEVN
ncbi:MAG: pilin, partial [Candidatus Parcubacteria bacterium]|nr:pilin [Candidatus Parcubacteria bacterium]